MLRQGWFTTSQDLTKQAFSLTLKFPIKAISKFNDNSLAHEISMHPSSCTFYKPLELPLALQRTKPSMKHLTPPTHRNYPTTQDRTPLNTLANMQNNQRRNVAKVMQPQHAQVWSIGDILIIPLISITLIIWIGS